MDLVKDYIDFKDMHRRVLSQKYIQKKQDIISSFFNHEDYEQFNKNGGFPTWEDSLVKKIIRECLKNQIKPEEIEYIPDDIAKKSEILKSVSDHFVQQEINKTLEIKTTIEGTFRKLCLQYFEDGVLTPDEEEDLYFEREILGIGEEEARQIIEETREEFEIAKPKDYILEILNNKSQTIKEIHDILNKKYDLDMDVGLIEQIIDSKLNHQIVFEKTTKEYSLVDDVLAVNDEKSKSIKYGRINYNYSIKEIDRNYDYVMASSNPSNQSCTLTININNPFFDDVNPENVLVEVLCDGIASHRISLLDNNDRTIDFSKQILKLKSHIRSLIRDQIN